MLLEKLAEGGVDMNGAFETPPTRESVLQAAVPFIVSNVTR